MKKIDKVLFSVLDKRVELFESTGSNEKFAVNVAIENYGYTIIIERNKLWDISLVDRFVNYSHVFLKHYDEYEAKQLIDILLRDWNQFGFQDKILSLTTNPFNFNAETLQMCKSEILNKLGFEDE